MNDAATQSGQQTQIQERLAILQSNTNSIESFFKDLYGLKDELNKLGKRVNSMSHPDNVPQEEKGKENQLSPDCRQATDGVIGSMDDIISHGNSLIKEVSTSILPALFRELDYLKRQI